jgi:hypothetical protein
MVNIDWKGKKPGPKRLSITAYREKRHKIFDLVRRGLNNVAVARECGLSPRRIGQIMERGGVKRALCWNSEAVLILVPRNRATHDGDADKLGLIVYRVGDRVGVDFMGEAFEENLRVNYWA